MITAKELIEEAKRDHEVYCKNYAEAEAADLKWPRIAGLMAVQAATRIREAARITAEDKDSVEVEGYSIRVYRNGRAASVKGSITMSRHQYKKLLRQMVEDWIGDNVQDWSAVDLSGLGED